MTTVPEAPDVLAVGAGPAGATTAALLARRGWSVVLVDRARFPRPKACGEFLSPGVIRSMERMSLSPGAVSSRAGVVRGWCLDLDGSTFSVDFGEMSEGLSLPRSDFDQHLLAVARAEGVRVVEGASYVSSRPTRDGSRRVVVTRVDGRRRPFLARVLVGAGGLRCPVAADLDLARAGGGTRKVSLTGHMTRVPFPPDRGRLILRGDLVVGLAPSDPSGQTWNVSVVAPASGYGRSIAREGPRAFFRQCLSMAGLPGVVWSSPLDAPLASGPFDRPAGPLFRDRAVLVGDAAGYYDPFTGQGIYQALRSAELVAPLVHRVLSGSLSPHRAFQQYRRLVGRERRSTRMLQVQVERAIGSPARRAVAARILARAPSLLPAIMKATTDRRTPATALLELVRHTLVPEHRTRRGAGAMTVPASRSVT